MRGGGVRLKEKALKGEKEGGGVTRGYNRMPGYRSVKRNRED